MARLFFLALASLAFAACSQDEVELFPEIPPDSQAGEFQAEIQEYLQQYEAEAAQSNLEEGMQRWEKLSKVLYRDIGAWDWLEKSASDDVVTLKRGTKLSDLPQEVRLAVEGVLNWDPDARVDEESAYYGDFCTRKEYLAILLDLLGGDHPIWNQYITIFERDRMNLTEKSWCLPDFVQLILENPSTFAPSLIRRVQEVARDRSQVSVQILKYAAILNYWQYWEGLDQWESPEAAEFREVARLMMQSPPSSNFPLKEAQFKDLVASQLALEALVLRLP